MEIQGTQTLGVIDTSQVVVTCILNVNVNCLLGFNDFCTLSFLIVAEDFESSDTPKSSGSLKRSDQERSQPSGEAVRICIGFLLKY